MKLSIIEGDENYVSTIVKLPELKPVNWLDNLMVANVFGYNCLVWKESNPDILYVFFPAECVIDNEFLKSNNSYRKSELNMDKDTKGFFEESGRVKAVKFKWVVSSGFLTPITFLGTIADWLKVWDTFHSIDWYNICKKYRSPETVRKERILASQWIKKSKYDRVIPTQFRLHTSTPQFLRFIEDFKEGDRIVITEKLHWTSAVFSNVLTKRPLSFRDKMAKFFWIRVEETEYFPLYSSRTVIKNQDINPNQQGGYYWEDIWGIYAKRLEWKIEKGITLYGEIVGFTPSRAYIQKGYHYGCSTWQSRFYCYRITSTTPDGNVIEFTDSQIRQYCKSRDIEVVPKEAEFIVTLQKEDYKNPNYYNFHVMYNDLSIRDGVSVATIESIVEAYSEYIEDMCLMNNEKVPREWVVIRRDAQETFSAYKLKSQLFLTHETKAIDEWVPDTEENS